MIEDLYPAVLDGSLPLGVLADALEEDGQAELATWVRDLHVVDMAHGGGYSYGTSRGLITYTDPNIHGLYTVSLFTTREEADTELRKWLVSEVVRISFEKGGGKG